MKLLSYKLLFGSLLVLTLPSLTMEQKNVGKYPEYGLIEAKSIDDFKLKLTTLINAFDLQKELFETYKSYLLIMKQASSQELKQKKHKNSLVFDTNEKGEKNIVFGNMENFSAETIVKILSSIRNSNDLLFINNCFFDPEELLHCENVSLRKKAEFLIKNRKIRESYKQELEKVHAITSKAESLLTNQLFTHTLFQLPRINTNLKYIGKVLIELTNMKNQLKFCINLFKDEELEGIKKFFERFALKVNDISADYNPRANQLITIKEGFRKTLASLDTINNEIEQKTEIKKKKKKKKTKKISVSAETVNKLLDQDKNSNNNNAIIITDSQLSIPALPFKFYNQRVDLFFTNPLQALSERGYNNPETINPLIIKHYTFSRTVDNYVLELGINIPWKNDGAGYHLPGEIIHKNGLREIGIFSYGVDSQGICYHRAFAKKIYPEIAALVSKRIYDAEFPALNKSEPIIEIIKNNNLASIKESEFVIEIEDKNNEMVIKLYKIQK